MATAFGKYTIEKKLGQGGMGAVYLAVDPALNRKVALKVITSDDEEMLERFHLEAQAVAKLKHPNIVQVHETGIEDKRHYFTMDYIEGASLETLIGAKTKLNFQNISKIILQIATALDYAHKQQIIHRDVNRLIS
jgi:serine/threonine-protein kinase